MQDQIIEGVGDEVLVSVLTVLVGSLLVTVCFFCRRRSSSNSIHPSNRDAVDSARSHLPLYSNRLTGDGNSVGDDNGNVVLPQNHYGMDNHCPVCLNEPRYPVETNCGHLFCAQCVIVYWRHGNWRGPIKCPVCRQQVSVLLQCFRPDQRPNSEDDSERQQLVHDINDYNRRHSGEPRPWLDYLYDLPILLRHLSSEFFTVGGLMYMFRIRIVLCFVAAIMYLVSPLDMIPEAVFGLLGLLDDIFVVLLLAVYVTIIYRRFLASRWEEESL